MQRPNLKQSRTNRATGALRTDLAHVICALQDQYQDDGQVVAALAKLMQEGRLTRDAQRAHGVSVLGLRSKRAS